mgnify:CR=1 FL=1
MLLRIYTAIMIRPIWIKNVLDILKENPPDLDLLRVSRGSAVCTGH